jgi:SAM-dependent methyltransferase
VSTPASAAQPGDRLAGAAYDAIARPYQRTRQSPVRRYIEAYTLWQLMGDAAGQAVLDAGCGDGWYARGLVARGARPVVAFDASAAMLDLARQAGTDGIAYHQADAAALPVLGAFDLVLAAYLLHYAPTADALQAMAAGLAANLVPGGRLVALVENPDPVPDAGQRYAPYGFSREGPVPVADGAPIRYALVAGRDLVRFDTHYYRRATYGATLAAAGFTAITWQPLQLDPACADAADPAWFNAYLEAPPVVALTAVRAAAGVAAGPAA